MKNILVALELEGDSKSLLEKTTEIALAFGSKAWLLHIAAPDPDFVGYDAGPQSERDFQADKLREEHRLLQEHAQELVEQGIDAKALLVQGATVQTIIEEVVKLSADLIIIGHHEYGLLQKIFNESVSEEIVQKSKVPVLLVPINQ